MKNSKKILSLILAAMMCAPLTGCSETTTTETADDTSAQTEETAVSETAEDDTYDTTLVPDEDEERIVPNIPATGDYGGDDILFATWTLDSWSDTVREYRDIYAEGLTGEGINDAVYNRNLKIEEAYNVKISQERIAAGDIGSAITNNVTAGDDVYDVAYPRVYELAGLYTKGIFRNLFDSQYIDFDQPWWDSDCVSALEIENILYAVTTAINVNDKDATCAVAFNKQIIEDNQIEDLYQLVKDGGWTFDKLSEICAACCKDTDGDGEITEADIYGFLGANDTMWSFFHGGGSLIITKDDDDKFVFSYGTEYDINVTTAIVKFMNEDWFFNHHLADNTDDDYFTQLFESGHGAFFWMRLDEVTNMRESDADFGILPTPKYSEDQDRYYNLVSEHTTGFLTIPATSTGDKFDETGIILEALACESYYTLLPEYVETTLKTKYSRDEESGDMVDIIISSRIYDPVHVFQFGGFPDTYAGFGKNNTTDIASTVAKCQKTMSKVIEKFIKAIEEQNQAQA